MRLNQQARSPAGNLGLGQVGIALSVPAATSMRPPSSSDLAIPRCGCPAGRSTGSAGSLRFLFGISGYRGNFTRMGFTQNEVADLSDRLVDDLVAWGDPETIAARIRQHLDAGTDHVMLHVLAEDGQPGSAEVARQLAGRLPGLAA
jgi:alkanesulfonate monooxygenase SsuD/methylene tetrahydromethanopterin reductase-like flavin-dependent oxidoreductase (luciferase family)